MASPPFAAQRSGAPLVSWEKQKTEDWVGHPPCAEIVETGFTIAFFAGKSIMVGRIVGRASNLFPERIEGAVGDHGARAISHYPGRAQLVILVILRAASVGGCVLGQTLTVAKDVVSPCTCIGVFFGNRIALKIDVLGGYAIHVFASTFAIRTISVCCHGTCLRFSSRDVPSAILESLSP